MNKWYKVKCSKCGNIITSLELGKNIFAFHEPQDEVKYELDVVNKVEHEGIIREILCYKCAEYSFDRTKYCTISGTFDTAVKFVKYNLGDIGKEND